MRIEHEYDRGGALAYLAAWDVHRARLFGRLEPTTGIEPFGRLVAQVMTVEPYASAKRVFWVVDNGSSHRGKASVDRLQGQWANLRLVHLPVHASWLNQIEIYFSVVQRKVLSPNDFTDLDEVEVVRGTLGEELPPRGAVRGGQVPRHRTAARQQHDSHGEDDQTPHLPTPWLPLSLPT